MVEMVEDVLQNCVQLLHHLVDVLVVRGYICRVHILVVISALGGYVRQIVFFVSVAVGVGVLALLPNNCIEWVQFEDVRFLFIRELFL